MTAPCLQRLWLFDDTAQGASTPSGGAAGDPGLGHTIVDRERESSSTAAIACAGLEKVTASHNMTKGKWETTSPCGDTASRTRRSVIGRSPTSDCTRKMRSS